MGGEIGPHYPSTIEEGISIPKQEAWTCRDSGYCVEVPDYLRELVEEIAFQARDDKRVDKRSGVSQRLPISVTESVVSNAEQRAARTGEKHSVARVADIYSALPSVTGKLELEYEGELKGADTVARELIRTAIGRVFSRRFADVNFQPVVQWFELGGELKFAELASSSDRYKQFANIKDLIDHVDRLVVEDKKYHAHAAAAPEMILEVVWAHRRIRRSEERCVFAEKPKHA